MIKKTNDAISSWSGFNYQGKVALLYVMQVINTRIGSNKSIDSLEIELEQKEDFVILDENIPISYHQVKALLSKNNLSGYKSALEKLVMHKVIGGNEHALCYLISANQISDWDTTYNIFKDDVIFYKYNDMIIDICQVVVFIRDEISKFRSELNVDIAYFELCNLLDEKISRIHKEGKTSSYRISFFDIVKAIDDSRIKQEISFDTREKERVYTHITTGIMSKFNEFCEISCNNAPKICDIDCGVKAHFDSILNANVWNWARIINPNKNIWNQLNYVENMASDKYRDYIISIFYHYKSGEVTKEADLFYVCDTLFNSRNKRIVPSFVNFSQLPRQIEKCIEREMMEIKKNDFACSYLDGNIIVGDTNGKMFSTIYDKITHFEVSEKSANRKITDFEVDITIVDRDDFIQKLGEQRNE